MNTLNEAFTDFLARVLNTFYTNLKQIKSKNVFTGNTDQIRNNSKFASLLPQIMDQTHDIYPILRIKADGPIEEMVRYICISPTELVHISDL